MLLITVLSNALRHADDIVCAAEARAFQPERSVGKISSSPQGKLVGRAATVQQDERGGPLGGNPQLS
jgi:hypothetical protein